MLKAAKNCNKCHNKTVKEAYHTVCQPCAGTLAICPKCGVARSEWIKDGQKVTSENGDDDDDDDNDLENGDSGSDSQLDPSSHS